MNLNVKKYLTEHGMLIGLFLILVVITVVTQGDFLSARNLSNLMRQSAINGLLSVGMTLIILTGGIDLSIGSVLALGSVLIGVSQIQWDYQAMGYTGVFYSSLLAVGVCALIGFLNGFMISFFRIPAFVVSLGVMVIARGLAMIVSGGASQSPMSEEFTNLSSAYLPNGVMYTIWNLAVIGFVFHIRTNLKRKDFKLIWLFLNVRSLSLLALIALVSYAFIFYKGLPLLFAFYALILSVVHVFLTYTPWGRSVYAIGSNEKAAYWSGISVQKIKCSVYVIMGLIVGLSSVLLTSRLNGADPNAGQLFELDAIAAVVIGGTSLNGGVGHLFGTLIGVLIMAVINNGMDMMGVSSFYQMVFKGLIIILAVSLDKRK